MLNTQEVLGRILETTKAISLLESVLLHPLICPPAGESWYLTTVCSALPVLRDQFEFSAQGVLRATPVAMSSHVRGAVLFPHVILEAAEVTEVG